jgi:hypothetical protein
VPDAPHVPEPNAPLKPYDVRIIEDRWATFRHIVEAVAIVAAGGWAFYTFVYQEKIKPAGMPAALTLGIAMSELGHTAQRDIVDLKLTFHNSGQTEIDVAADGYSIWGIRYKKDVVPRRREEKFGSMTERDLGIASKTIIKSSMELRDMAVNGYPGNHIILEPADTLPIEATVVIPHDAYDLLYARVIAVPLKTSQTAKIPVTVKHESDGSYWLTFPKDSDAFEDDDDSYFAVPQ